MNDQQLARARKDIISDPVIRKNHNEFMHLISIDLIEKFNLTCNADINKQFNEILLYLAYQTSRDNDCQISAEIGSIFAMEYLLEYFEKTRH